jgi:hypothetical protein
MQCPYAVKKQARGIEDNYLPFDNLYEFDLYIELNIYISL